MADGEALGETRVRCQACPAAARRGWREDRLCASYANTHVSFHGIKMPVCAIHKAAFTRWGTSAHANAEALSGWSSSATTRASNGLG